MKELDAALTALYCASVTVDTTGSHNTVKVNPEWIHLGLKADHPTRADYEDDAVRLFELKIAVPSYTGETLCRLQCERLQVDYADVPDRMRRSFDMFAAVAGLMPLDVEPAPPPAKLENTRERGFAYGFDDDDYGGHSDRIYEREEG